MYISVGFRARQSNLPREAAQSKQDVRSPLRLRAPCGAEITVYVLNHGSWPAVAFTKLAPPKSYAMETASTRRVRKISPTRRTSRRRAI